MRKSDTWSSNSKFSPQIFETYFRLYGRVTNYTVGSSIFCKLHLRVFDFLTFILQGPQFCKKYTLGLSKIGIFSYTLGLGVRPNILTPRHFLLEVPPWAFMLFIIHYRNSKQCLLLLKSIAIDIGVCILYLINEL